MQGERSPPQHGNTGVRSHAFLLRLSNLKSSPGSIISMLKTQFFS
jgi:hypothetical protein